MKHSFRLALAVLVGGIAVVATHAAPPEPGFWLVATPSGAGTGAITCLTSDGSLAAGYWFVTTPKIVGASFTWTAPGGRNDFGLQPGMPPINDASGLSDTGVVVGSMWIDGQYDKSRAYRWPARGALQDLGVLPGETRSFAYGIDGSGTVVVGHAEHGPMTPLGQAFRWTPAKGMEGIGYLKPFGSMSMATAVSRDGATIVGISRSQSLDFEAFVWREGVGMTGLPTLPGSPTVETYAEAVNADGTVVVGSSTSATGHGHAVRWINGEIEDLMGSAFPGSHSTAYAISDDGAVVGGVVGGLAIVWTQASGFVLAADYLAQQGVAVPTNYMLESVYAISGDGLTFGGQARNLTTNIREGFVATVPVQGECKVDCDASGELDIDDFICFQTFFALGDTKADCDGDLNLSIDDFICFQTAFVLGC